MKKKKVVSLVLGFLMVMGLALPGMASPDIGVYMDGRRMNFEVPPQMIGGRTMLPLRAIFEEMGAEVAWDAATQTATAKGRCNCCFASRLAFANCKWRSCANRPSRSNC